MIILILWARRAFRSSSSWAIRAISSALARLPLNEVLQTLFLSGKLDFACLQFLIYSTRHWHDHQFDRLPFLQWLYNILTLRFELQKHGQNLNVHAMSSNSRRLMIHLIKIEAKRFTRQSSPLRRLTAVAMDMVAFDWVKRWTTNDWTRKCEYHWVRVAILSIERTWKWWKGARVLEGCLPPK